MRAERRLEARRPARRLQRSSRQEMKAGSLPSQGSGSGDGVRDGCGRRLKEEPLDVACKGEGLGLRQA